MGDFGGDCQKTRKTDFTPDPPASEVTKEMLTKHDSRGQFHQRSRSSFGIRISQMGKKD